MTKPILEAIDTLSEPSEMVRWLMRAGPVAEGLNRDSKLDVFRANAVPAPRAHPSDQANLRCLGASRFARLSQGEGK